MGLVPAHQATLFRGNVLKKIKFNSNYVLAADLEMFLRISKIENLVIKTTNINIVNIAIGGISNRLFKLRINEVIKAYKSSFGYLWLIPFFTRYIKKLMNFL